MKSAFLAAATSLVIGCGPKSAPERVANQAEAKPLVFAHRGASGYRPEHTRAAYLLAIEQGADYIEPDVVASKDGVLVARHENEISGTTDVAARSEFADRKATKVIDGESVTGWFTEDFTLAELKTLRARERLPELRPASAGFDGQFEILTLAEVLALAAEESTARKRAIGVCPETKHPSYFRSIGLALEPLLLDVTSGVDRAATPLCIQSFEVGNLRELASLTDVPLVQLIWIEGSPADKPELRYRDMITPSGLAEIATYAAVVSPHKTLVIERAEDNSLGAETSLVADAHAAGLKVVVYTFRAEARFLPNGLDLEAELERYIAAGIDGLFTDFPDVALDVRQALAGSARGSL